MNWQRGNVDALLIGIGVFSIIQFFTSLVYGGGVGIGVIMGILYERYQGDPMTKRKVEKAGDGRLFSVSERPSVLQSSASKITWDIDRLSKETGDICFTERQSKAVARLMDLASRETAKQIKKDFEEEFCKPDFTFKRFWKRWIR